METTIASKCCKEECKETEFICACVKCEEKK
jgi:hypothetical protein